METSRIELDIDVQKLARDQRDWERKRQEEMDATKITLQLDVDALVEERRNKYSDIRELRDISSLAFSDFYTMLIVCLTWNVAGGIFLICIRSWSALLGAFVGSALSCMLWGFFSLVLSHGVWIYTLNYLWFITCITIALNAGLLLIYFIVDCCETPPNQEEQNVE
ncbi:Hypothetical predicted protein [Cloeon dipterum]|uniref:Transmembrane protein n=1 Tax=Cloeon dipterum TaxID=197152 RepID=A0A8S1DM74_9INSE|nr:Hypothetical predicted protein [Cloeon dipterum]